MSVLQKNLVRNIAMILIAFFLLVGISHAETPPPDTSFLRNLSFRMTHPDVRRLQQMLNGLGFTVAPEGAGSAGKETSYFGERTRRALMRFQAAYALPTTGFFGPLSRAQIYVALPVPSTRASTTSPLPLPPLVRAPSVPVPLHATTTPHIVPVYQSGGGGSPTVPSDTAAPSAPGTLRARAATSSTDAIWLAWTASSDDQGVASYTIYRNSVAVGTTNSVQYTDTGLSASTTYSYYVVAADAAGHTTASRTVYSQAGAWADGAGDASGDAAPYPSLLNAYVAAPPWRAAGVEYAVGYPAATVLRDPATIAMAGVSLNLTDHIVTVSGTNVALDAYDFSLNGGWQVYVTGSNVTITNSNFKMGANANPAIVFQGTGGGSIAYNTIDGDDKTSVYSGIVNLFGTGSYTFEYNWFKNAYADFINAGASSQAQIIRYNLFENGGSGNALGAHGDWIQNYGASNRFTSVSIAHNTFVQNRSDLATQGINHVANQGPTYTRFDTVDFTRNTVVLPSSATAETNVNYVFRVDPSEVSDTTTVEENFVDPTGVYYSWFDREVGGPGPYTGTTTTTLNRNMTSGDLFASQGTYLPIQTRIITPSTGAAISDSVTLLATAQATDGVSEVRFKVGNTLIGSALTSSPYTTDWDVTALDDGAYTLSAVGRDANGRYATTSISVTVSNDPPVISSVSSGAPTTTGTTISWTTNTAATSRVVYGATNAYGSATSSNTRVTSHSMVVTGLTSNTLYHYAVVSTDELGKTSTSSDGTFTTEIDSAYNGPGDVFANASIWWGLRAYQRSAIGSAAVRVSCGGSEYDIATNITGGLATTTLASNCGVNTVYLKTLYDQTGNGFHVSQSDEARQAQIILNCIGVFPCIRSTTSTTYTTSGVSVSSPLTLVFGLKPSTYTVQSNILSDSNQQSIYMTNANEISTYDGATITHTLSDATWHSLQIGFGNYTSDTYTPDGATENFTGGSNRPGLAGTLSFLSYISNGYGFRGDAVEGGIWPTIAAGATTTAMHSNLLTYWGW